MEKGKSAILKFITWLTIGIATAIIGISGVFAQEVDVGYVSNKTQVLINVPVASGGAPITLNQNVTNNSGMIIQMWVNISNITITKDYIYMLELYTPDAKLNNQINSVVIHGGSGQICQFIGLTSIDNGYPKIYFKCPANLDYISVDIKSMEQYGIVSATNFRWSYSYLRYYTEENDLDLGPVISNQTANTNNIINNQNSNTQSVINNNNTNSQNIINNQNSNTNKEIESQKVCTETTIDKDDIKTEGKYLNSNGGENNNANFGITDYIEITKSSIIKVIKARAGSAVSYCFYDSSKTKISCDILGTNPQVGDTYTIPDNTKYVRFSINKTDNNPQYEITGACINGNQAVNDAVKEQTKTSKGILSKIGDLISYINPLSENFFVYKLIDLLGDLLKSLFIPRDTFLNTWYTDFRAWIELKLGFLATPITLFLDFINLYLNLEEESLVINIPQIVVPNFEDKVLIEAQTFDWGGLLNSKPSFQNLWNLYLDFIDLFLILNFIGLCENTYNRIFGGDTTQYEYYTTEETYNINDDTGEASNHMLRQRTTRRQKV